MSSQKFVLAILFAALVYAVPVYAQDTDGDGIPNSFEYSHSCLNRYVPDGDLDPDNDQMTSLQEYQWDVANDPVYKRLNPCAADSDGAGEPDGAEVAAGKNPVNHLDDTNFEYSTHDWSYTAQLCDSGYSPCVVGANRINGRDTMNGGAEPNQPNSISADPCPDGTMGDYHADESIDAMIVAAQGTNYFTPSASVKVQAKVYCWGVEDYWYVYYTESADFPSWTLEASGVCPAAGVQYISTTFSLTSTPGNHAIRVILSYDVSLTTCDAADYSDTDDVVLSVIPPCPVGNDLDNDLHGVGCYLGTDCNDGNPNVWDTCGACLDSDGDGYYSGCNQYVTLPGPDCDDTPSGGGCHNTCTTYFRDVDSDSYGSSSVSVTRCSLPSGYVTNNTDCNDANTNVWDKCGTCVDADADGWYLDCNRYLTVNGPDCDDDPASGGGCHATCSNFYQDNDADGYGIPSTYVFRCSAPTGYVGNSTDCNDLNTNVWNKCATCVDADSDLWFKDCNRYLTINGPDCDDNAATGGPCHNTCTNFYQDSDADTYGNAGVSLNRCTAPSGYVANNTDCSDTNTNAWNTCATCVDADADGWYLLCNRYLTVNGPDCDDNATTGGPCHNTCTNFYQDSDADTYGNASVFLNRCTAPSGYVANSTDCSDTNTNAWNTCATCVDADADTWYLLCNRYNGINGPDCSDTNTNAWNTCATCVDADADGWYKLCNRYQTINGPDCDDDTATGGTCHNTCSNFYQDSDADTYGNVNVSANRCTAPAGYVANSTDCNDTNTNTWNTCATCVDADADGWYLLCNRYQTVSGPDCSDTNTNAWNTCATCVDADADGWYKLCNRYQTVNGPDCDDNSSTGGPCHNTCTNFYQDSDADTYGNLSVSLNRCTAPSGYVANSTDCNDANTNVWNTCATCVDADADTWYVGCNRYLTINGPDCDDLVSTGGSCHNTCTNFYQDSDADTYGNVNVSVNRCTAPSGYVANSTDCSDTNTNAWNTCATCIDADADTWYKLCNRYQTVNGPDCDDNVATGGPCHNTCSNFYQDSDADAYGNVNVLLNRCTAPSGYVANSTDCNDANTNTWNTCATCIDADADTWYKLCNRYQTVNGPDCDDEVATGGPCHNTCANFYQDSDADAYGNNGVSLNRCTAPAGYVANNTDCNDANTNTWNTCATCIDADADTWYKLCNRYQTVNGPDCDDNVATGGSCHNTCANFYQDSDADTYGNNSVSANRCTAPSGYVSNNTDCNDANTNVWNKCATCVDVDLDTWYLDCNRYQTVNGPDCNDGDTHINPGHAEVLCDGKDNDCNAGTPDDRDQDADGLSYCLEAGIGTSDTNWDSDGDRLPDKFEYDNRSGHTAGKNLDPLNALDGLANFDTDLNSNKNEYWNGSDLWNPDPVPGVFANPGCYYWADADGDGTPAPSDLIALKLQVAGAPQSFLYILPHTFDTLDLDRDGYAAPSDLTSLKLIISGSDRPGGYPSQALSLEVVSAPSGSVAVGTTTHVTVSVHSVGGTHPYASGFGVMYTVVSGNAVLLGGEGTADGQPAGNRYDMSMEALTGAKANIVVLVTGSGPITIGAKIPACGTPTLGRWNNQVVLSPSVVINP